MNAKKIERLSGYRNLTLKQCPFCDGDGEVVKLSQCNMQETASCFFFVYCTRCNSQTCSDDTEEIVVIKWNLGQIKRDAKVSF